MGLIDADSLEEQGWIMHRTVIVNPQTMEMQTKKPTDFPTIIDAVSIVRCKDCEFYTADELWCRRLGLCGAFDPDDFCSHAERREDGET